ncbi:MAG: nucleoside phosphorylase [Bdellovibrionales bacterium]|nr:nucleoside phosphorylase [Bdellovibrionales bacterium]
MSLPLDKNKLQQTSFVTPKEFINFAQKSGHNTSIKKTKTIFTWVKSYSEDWLNKNEIKTGHLLFNKIYQLPSCVINPYIGQGAPASVIKLEEYIELGVKEFVFIGIAGAIDQQLKPGDIVICDKAYRDEGTSYHYLPSSSSIINANEELVFQIEQCLKNENIFVQKGTSWTTDAPYRETKEEISKYRGLGVKTVEMEASALYAVSQFRGVKAISLFIVSDVLSGDSWQPHFNNKIIKKSFLKLLSAIAKHWGGWS